MTNNTETALHHSYPSDQNGSNVKLFLLGSVTVSK